MEVKIYDRNSQDLLVEKIYPNWNGESFKMVIDQTSVWEHLGKDTSYREIYFEGIHIGFGRAQVKDVKHLKFDSDVETVEMHFALKGSNSAKAEQFAHRVCFSTNQHNILFANGLHADMQWDAEEFHSCEINMSPELFKKYLPEGDILFERFRNAIERGSSGLLAKENRPIHYQMHQIIHDIWNCDTKDIFKRMYLEYKVIELLTMQLEQFTSANTVDSSIKKADIDKIYAVRDYILSNLDAESSLTDLARLVGTNEYTLKHAFKQIFGISIFAFWTDLKMQRAKTMLMAHNMAVHDVALRTGYSSSRHFSTAFKRKFGLSPRQVSKQ